MSRRTLLALLALAASLLAVAPAWAKSHAASWSPTIKSIRPLTANIGDKLTIRGKGFVKGKKKNTVVFMGAGKRVVWVKADSATSKTITVKLPDSLAAILTNSGGALTATRLQVRVISKKSARSFTKLSQSPKIGPKNGSTPGGVANCVPHPSNPASDVDGDMLPDALEVALKTDPCKYDTDGDGIGDGYEYQAALDLNRNANSNAIPWPYPGKKPYPNPLDGTDATKDYDGDGMTNAQEFGAWNLYGGRILPVSSGQSFPYSDGNQTSTAPNGVGAMDLDGNGRFTDEEKDADGDGLPNWLEIANIEPTPFTGCVFTGPANAPNIFTDCGGTKRPNGNTFRIPLNTVTGAPSPPYLAQTSYLDPDSDGDGVNDGADDQDLDGLTNLNEITSTFTDPQDPCDPNADARTCPTHPSHT
jgi:hypothetical protein